MPLTYWTSTPFLLKGLYHGSFQQSLLYQILFYFSLAVSLPCDPSTLPRGVRISQNGPVLKLTCDSGLQPLEMAHFTSSAGLLLPIPSKRKFARYVCVNGASYQRINAQGIERSFFFCTDGQSNLCDPLENSAEHGHLQVEGTVAIWRSVTGSQRNVLYCAHGVWHRLGGGPLPYGVTVKSQQKEKVLSTPGTTASTSAGASNGEIISTISATVPFPSVTPHYHSRKFDSRTVTPSEPSPTSSFVSSSPRLVHHPQVPSTPVRRKLTRPQISRPATYPHSKHYFICGECLPCTARSDSQMRSNGFLLHDFYCDGCSDCQLVGVDARVSKSSTNCQCCAGAGTIKKHNRQCVKHFYSPPSCHNSLLYRCNSLHNDRLLSPSLHPPLLVATRACT
ncbi:hypothetical protein EmuJ_000830200 [Echinococcus multilocularis]|uniref:Uncharacterized protein n=1 Tax=Echinococcus multilocularis TaxID=6211 RepID=A0A068YBQ0_ECHMU|nr:hypothetical protein EmuJ_000830200 [Echinococcus multilocularis]